MSPESTEAVVVEVRVVARPETVFMFFTGPARMVRWKGVSADLDARPGGAFRVDVTANDRARGEYVEVVRLRHLGLPEEAWDSHRKGWDHFLPRLAGAAAGGDPGPDPWVTGVPPMGGGHEAEEAGS